jgi:hypothetical protein
MVKDKWIKEFPKRCDHYNFKQEYLNGNPRYPNFYFGSWDEQGYFSCSKCGMRFWEGHNKEYIILRRQI